MSVMSLYNASPPPPPNFQVPIIDDDDDNNNNTEAGRTSEMGASLVSLSVRTQDARKCDVTEMVSIN